MKVLPVLVALICSLGLVAQSAEEDTPVVEEATGVTVDDKQAPETRVALDYNAFLVDPDAPKRSISEEISLDMVDLNALRERIDDRLAGKLVRMSVMDCIHTALANNPDVLMAEIEPLKSASDVFTSKGEFDPVLQTKGIYTRSSATVSQEYQSYGGISSVDSYNTNISSSLSGKLHSGTIYNLAFTLDKEENTYGNFIEEFNAATNFTITQPLMRGLGDKVNRVRILASRNSKAISNAQLRLQIMNTTADVIKAYWDLVGSVENLKVKQASLENAERLLRINETRREIGTAADIEVLQSKAGVASRQSDLFSARAQVANASDYLKQLMEMRDGDVFSSALIIPTDRPEQVELENFDLDVVDDKLNESVQKALEKRPEVRMTDLQIANAELDRSQARNEMMPQFDLTGSYGQGGRDHKLRETLKGIKNGDQYFYTYGFQASIPIGNRAARGAYERANLSVRTAEIQRQKTLQGLMFNVHLAARAVATNNILVESNRQSRRLQEANVVAEEKRLRLGVTTSWQVLQVQEDLTAAQTMEVQALTAYEKALIDLQLAEGGILEDFGITVEEVEEEESNLSYFESIKPRWE